MSLVQKHLERLRGQTAWITGGKRIGRTVAYTLAEQGVNLVLSYRRSAAEAMETASMAEKLGVRALTVQADVSDRSSVAEAVEQVREVFPRIDILVNMASVYEPVGIDAAGEREWKENIDA
ncbi:MAG TPA: SDR family NAD(P)-dependent oxidoreductase, partial [Bryobacteraceae bacterium]|nr:SDR family NAD(P)-dependent oxidoreductase [Bryobacteraceae bacterium]